MLDSKTVLIVEENGYRGLDLASEVEDHDGRVAGPVATAAEAFAILETEDISAALIDCELCNGDAAGILERLSERGVPLVAQTSAALPMEDLGGRVAVLRKPVDPRLVIDRLLVEMAKATEPEPV